MLRSLNGTPSYLIRVFAAIDASWDNSSCLFWSRSERRFTVDKENATPSFIIRFLKFLLLNTFADLYSWIPSRQGELHTPSAILSGCNRKLATNWYWFIASCIGYLLVFLCTAILPTALCLSFYSTLCIDRLLSGQCISTVRSYQLLKVLLYFILLCFYATLVHFVVRYTSKYHVAVRRVVEKP